MRGNSILVTGTIYPDSKEAEGIDLNISAKGTSWVTFKVAAYGGKNQDGTKADKIYYRCMAFGDMAEAVVDTFSPGDQIIVAGNLQSDNWTDRDGNKRYQTKVMVSEIGASLRFQMIDITRIEREHAPVEVKAQPEPQKDTGTQMIAPNEAPF